MTLASFAGAFAQQKPDSSSLWNLSLKESVVSASHRVDYSTPNDRLTRVDISRYNVLADAVRSLSGVQIKDYGGVGGLKTVNLRSLGSEYTGVYIDGIQVDNAQNMQVDLGRFSLDNISGIDLYASGKVSSILSAKEYSSASSIYLNSIRPEFCSGKNTNVNIKQKIGSFGSYIPSVGVEHRFCNGISLRTSLVYTSYNGRYKFHRRKYIDMPDGSIAGYDTLMTRSNSDLRSGGFDMQIFSGEESRSSWNIKAYLYDSQRGLPGPVIRRLRQTTADRQWDQNAFIQGRYERSFGRGDRNTVSVSAKASFDYLRYKTFPQKDPYSMPYDNKYSQSNLYASFSYRRMILDNLSINEAVDFQYTYLDSNTRGFVFPSRYSLWGASAVVWTPGRFDISANIVYNLSLDYYSKPTSPSLEAFSKVNDSRDSFTPTLKLGYRPFGNFSVMGFVKRSYRMPSFNDLYYTLIGNSNLSAESAWQSDLTLEDFYSLENGISIQPRVEVYYNHVTDKIIAIPTANQFRWSMYNIGNVHIIGTDAKIKVSKAFDKDWTVSALGKYSLQDAKDYTSQKSFIWKNQIPYVAKHSGSLTIEAAYRGWRASLVQTYSSRRWSTGANIDDYLIHPWTTSDIFVSNSVKTKRGQSIEFGLNLNNILSQQYEFVQGYPMPGFNYMVYVALIF